MRNFKMLPKALGTITANVELKYLCMLLRGKALYQFDTQCAQVGSTTISYLNRFILGLGMYFFFPVNNLSKQECAMRQGVSKPRELKVRRYAAHLIDINDYLATFPEAKESNNIVEKELNEILLNSMKNVWNKKVYGKGFDCENITKKDLLICLNTQKLRKNL